MMSTSARPNRSSACTTACGSVYSGRVALCRWLLSAHREYDQETGVRNRDFRARGRGSARRSFKRCFSELENAVEPRRKAYRGKVLSLDAATRIIEGSSRGLMVHKLPPVRRENVILPEATLKLLDGNILNFVGNRAQLRKLGQSTRKGILLYGPPGTGKTHTIRYLASNLPGHTTLIITAAQVALLGAYIVLARPLQPVMVVIEDVDLIPSDSRKDGRTLRRIVAQQAAQRDGRTERGCRYLFVLTTNRPGAA